MRRPTIIILAWFFGLNVHLLVTFACLIKWRLDFPGARLSDGIYWEPSQPGLAFALSASAALALAGTALPRITPRGTAPYFVRFLLFEMAATVAAVFGNVRGNPLLAIPTLVGIALLYAGTFPTWKSMDRGSSAT